MAEAVKPKRATGARERLMQAGLELFLQRAYEDVPTEEILERAGVSRGALYHHFPGKIDLFRAVFLESERRNIRRIGGGGAARGGVRRAPPPPPSPGKIDLFRAVFMESERRNIRLIGGAAAAAGGTPFER